MLDWLKRLFLGKQKRLPRENKLATLPDVDLTIQRTAYHQDLSTPAGTDPTCPECGADISAVQGPYLVAAIDDDDTVTDTFVMGGDFVYYCPSCPTVVADTAELKVVTNYYEDVVGTVRVMGYIDMNAIPESQRGLSVDEIDLPLVPFVVGGLAVELAPKWRKQRKRKKRRKRRR